MSSVLAHSLAGMSVWALARRAQALRPFEHRAWYGVAAVGGLLPDIDSLIGLPHRGPTHTLGFALAAGALVATTSAACRNRRSEAWPLAPVVALAVWLHPLFDLLSGGGPDVALFAPFWGRLFHPVAGGLPLHSYAHGVGGLFALATDPMTLRGMLMEAAIFGPFFTATVMRRGPLAVVLAASGLCTWAAFAIAGAG